MEKNKTIVKKFVSDTKTTAKKLPVWLLPLLLVAGALSIILTALQGFNIWLVLMILFWSMVYYKGLPWLVAKSLNVIYVFLLITVVISYLIVIRSEGASVGSPSSTSSVENSGDVLGEYLISGADEIVAGWAQAEDFGGGKIRVDFVIVLEDSAVVNNGKCIDKVGDWCSNDPDGVHADIESVKYHYAMTFKNTENSETVAASTLWPVHCNGEALKADPRSFSINVVAYADQPDLTCNKASLATFEPTNLFLVRNRAVFDSLDVFLNSDKLAVYDISSTYTVSETSDATSQTVSSGNSLSSNEYHTAKAFKTYSISIK